MWLTNVTRAIFDWFVLLQQSCGHAPSIVVPGSAGYSAFWLCHGIKVDEP